MLTPGTEGVTVVAVGVVDADGVRGTAGVNARWDQLDPSPESRAVEAPGDGRTWRALFGRAHRTFRRLDPLSQALLVAAEAAGVREIGTKDERDRTAVVLGSAIGALDADVRFVASLAPDREIEAARFAYTLPSTAIGELSMSAGLRGPSIFLSTEEGSPAPLQEAAALIAEGRADVALAARVEAIRADAAAEMAMEPRVEATVIVLRPGGDIDPGAFDGGAWIALSARALG